VAVIYTDPNDFSEVRDKLEAAGCTFLSAERELVPTTTVSITDPELVLKINKLIERAGGLRRRSERLPRRRPPRREEED
jgi:transcriptional/translational regulatory protein YebC/TACO1